MSTNITTLVKSIQDIMRKDAGTYGDAQRLEQIGWMLFLKIFDDRESELGLVRDDYRSPLPKALRWSTWAADDEGITGEALLSFVDGTLMPKLKELPGNSKLAGIIRMTFDDANNYMKNGTLLRQVVNKINGIDFNIKTDRHLFGDIYEKLLRDLQAAGNAGEFYTPRAVTQFIVDQIDPRLGERLLDPACGTGGFLTCAIEHLRKQARKAQDEKKIQDAVAGIEKKHLPHVLCMTNMLLHGIDEPSSIRHDNTLSRPLNDYGPKDRVDIIVTNPPFGGMEEDGIESNFPSAFRTRETADLFLVLIMNLLKPGGRAGMVLPDGTLFGEGVKTRIKEALLRECNLHTIVRLPNGVFAPYTSIRTNLLFFTKGEPTKEIWYYEHPYPPGAKSYNKTKPIRIEEFDAEKAWWNNRVENEHAWRVPIEQIVDGGFNLDIKNPHAAEMGMGDLSLLIPQYQLLLDGIEATRRSLQAQLGSALSGGASVAEPEALIRLATDLRGGVSRLREVVLHAAVHGTLVAQSGRDEPASAVLARSRATVARQMQHGRAKQEKPAATLAPNEMHFDLPRGWVWARVVDTGQYINGLAFKPSDWKSRGRPIIRIQNLSGRNREFNYTDGEVDDAVIVQDGDLLVSWSATLDAFIWRGVEGVLNQHIFRVIPNTLVDKDYLYWLMKWVIRRLAESDHLHGLVMGHINRGPFLACPVPIPPLTEQRRIVAKVDELMKLVDQLESQLAASEEAGTRLLDALVAELTPSN